MTPEQFEAIEEHDASGGEDLQFYPPVWSDRRALLQLIREEREAVATAIRELDALVFDNDGSGPQVCTTLQEVIDEMRAIRGVPVEEVHRLAELQRELHAPFYGTAVQSGWMCSRGRRHAIGEFCECEL